MSLQFLIRLVLLPGLLMRRGPVAYYLGSLALQALALAAAFAWLLTPVALWQVYGHWWMLLWLIPTAATIFAQGMMPEPGSAPGRPRGEEGSAGRVRVAEPPSEEAGRQATMSAALGLAWLVSGPPWWYRAGEQFLAFLTALCWALVVMLQWGLWGIVSVNLIRPWGFALAVVIMAAQMLTLFERRPPRGEGPGTTPDSPGPTGPPDSGRPAPVDVPPPAPTRSAAEPVPSSEAVPQSRPSDPLA